MISFPVLHSLTIENYGLFPESKKRLFVVTFQPGSNAIIGINGSGKTTLVDIIVRCLTGPYNLPSATSGTEFGQVRPRIVHMPRRERHLFGKRVADGAEHATATLVVGFGTKTVEIRRRLSDLALDSFSIDGQNVNLAKRPSSTDAEDTRYHDEMVSLFGVASFFDALIVLHFLVFMLEDRRALVWDSNAQRQIFRVLLLPAARATEHAKAQQEVVSADSAVRKAYRFTYDFVFDYLCASVLLRWLQGSSDPRSAVSVLNICADQPGNLLDGTADLVLSVCGREWVTLARGRYRALCEAKGIDRRWQAGMFHLVHAVAKRDAQQEERLKNLFDVLGDAGSKSLSNVYLEGAIDNLDLRAVSFRNVTFGNIEFASCRFDETTKMEDCTFSANLDFENCHGAGLLTITGGSTSVHARSAFQREQVRGVDHRISIDQIEEAIRFVLWKFHRGAGLKSIIEDNIRSSAKSSFAFGDQVLDVLIKFGVLERFQSATRHNVKILAKSDVVQLINNNYKRGRLKEAFDELVRRLVR